MSCSSAASSLTTFRNGNIDSVASINASVCRVDACPYRCHLAYHVDRSKGISLAGSRAISKPTPWVPWRT